VGIKSQRNISFESSRSRWEDTEVQFSIDSQDGKGKVFPLLPLLSTTSWRRAGNESLDPLFMTSALDGVEWSTSRPGCFTPGVRSPDDHWTGDPVGPRIGQDDVGYKKNYPCWESKPGGLTCSLSLYRLKYPGSSIHKMHRNCPSRYHVHVGPRTTSASPQWVDNVLFPWGKVDEVWSWLHWLLLVCDLGIGSVIVGGGDMGSKTGLLLPNLSAGGRNIHWRCLCAMPSTGAMFLGKVILVCVT
jgi:hypothetical protein